MIVNATVVTERDTQVSVSHAPSPGAVVLTVGGADDGPAVFVVMSLAKLAELQREIGLILAAT